MIDLRSDTVTRPTPQMRQAMAQAEVGDDVLGDDPTVIALERRTAEVLGKARGVYMPSGTMTNQVAIRTHTEPGDEILLEAEGHSYFFESGGPSALSGVSCRLIAGRRGVFTGDDVRAILRPKNEHFPRTKLVCVEKTHNRGGGMRQAGIIAAGALYALEHHRDRLAEDHQNAQALVRGLARLEGIEADADAVETNIVFFRVTATPAAELVEKLRAEGVLVLAAGPHAIRAVTNLMVSREDINTALEAFARALGR